MTNEFESWQEIVSPESDTMIDSIVEGMKEIHKNNYDPSTLLINPSDLNALMEEIGVPQLIIPKGELKKLFGMDVVVSNEVSGVLVK